MKTQKIKPKEASGISIHCSCSSIEDIVNVIPNPSNPNRHSDSQIGLLARIIRNQGWRSPIVISRRSGFVVKGHGRLEAAKLLQVQSVPIDYQEYETEASEWADMVADNKIAELAEVSKQDLKEILDGLGSIEGFDMTLTGYDEQEISALIDQVEEAGTPADEWEGMPEFNNPAKGFNTVSIHFKTKDRLEEFCKLTGLEIKESTKFSWFPSSDQTYNEDSLPTDDSDI